MNRCKIFLGFVLWLIPFTLFAQRTISGRITDADDGAPIPGAAVFIANTTVGTTTDTTGFYRLILPGEGSYTLVVSHVGYKPVSKDIEQGKVSLVFHAALRSRDLEDVTVSAKVRSRNKDVVLFWQTILGTKPSKKTLQPLNPEAVFYYFNSKTQKLTVTCQVPLQIINYETGYQIQYLLHYFSHDYETNISAWEGKYMFTELEPATFKQKKIYADNRKKVYQVSINNLIKALYHNSTLEDGFLFVYTQKRDVAQKKTGQVFLNNESEIRSYLSNSALRKYNLIDSDYLLWTDTITGCKTFQIPPNLDVVLFSFGKPVTERNLEQVKGMKLFEKIGLFRNSIITPGEPVHIFSDGSFKNPIHLSPVFDSKSLSGLNMILPADYHPNGKMQIAATGVNEQPSPEQMVIDSLTRVTQHFDEQLSVFRRKNSICISTNRITLQEKGYGSAPT